MTIFLYGPSATGKTTLGPLLAENLNLPFIDLDAEIETHAGMPIPDIFTTEGEPGFRAREHAALEQFSPSNAVIALGGGALLNPESRALAESRGPILCLTAPVETLAARLRADTNPRPLLADDPETRLRTLLARRAEHYASFPLQLSTANLHPSDAAWEFQILLGRFHVKGMGTPYDVVVQPGGLDTLGDALHARGLLPPAGVVMDSTVGGLYLERVRKALEGRGFPVKDIVIPPGEAFKTIETVGQIWAGLLAGGIERGSTVVAVGGGVVGDLAGFAAATFLRGVKWVAVPTTLLAMVDASLGGKTGADLPQGKNLVGAFHAPRLVLADPTVLRTLPLPELRAGMAELIKHGVIADPKLFEQIRSTKLHQEPLKEENLESLVPFVSLVDQILSRAMAVKVKVICEDPFEQGFRAALNLGHTVGHAVEWVSGFRLRHGEAVAIGMVAEARIAERMGLAARGLADEIADCLRGVGLPTEIPLELDRAAILRTMQVDKKKAGGKVKFALPVRIGEVQVGVEVGDGELGILNNEL
ncbi:MAG: 3-dehydroquinate synthase [Anaerolineales bacterium]|nr:3-dehydroquinate synthase [Anaerolineales bacterium]